MNHDKLRASMVTRIGPLATINREPGQARKGAATAVDSGAGVWLVRVATLISLSFLFLSTSALPLIQARMVFSVFLITFTINQ